MRRITLLLVAIPLAAHDPITTKLTWTRDLSRLINRRCMACHDANASIPLATYAEARPWAKAIRDQVMTRQMPPWGAVPGFGLDLKGDPSLTQTEIDTVVRWVEGGAPEGDPALLPQTEPAQQQVALALTSRLLPVGCDWKTPAAFTLLGLRPEGIGPQNEMRLVLTRPNGSVQPLIWIRGLSAQAGRKPADFVFAQPVTIPRGSVIHLETDVEADAALALSPEAAWLRLPEKEIRRQLRHCPAP